MYQFVSKNRYLFESDFDESSPALSVAHSQFLNQSRFAIKQILSISLC